MQRKAAPYLTIGAIACGILTGIACDRETGSDAITARSDAGKPAPDLAKTQGEGSEQALIHAVEYATGANHDGETVDWNTIREVDAMWRIASLTTAEQGKKAFAGSQGVEAAPQLDDERPAYSECEAKLADETAVNDLLPVLFQHVPADEARAHWEAMRGAVASSEFVWVTCAESPKMVVAVRDNRVIAARESLDAELDLQPKERPESDEPEPGGPPPAKIALTSPVANTAVVFGETEAVLPHTLSGVNTSRTLRFKVKAPGHLDAEVGALPMDVLTMLQGGEPQTEFAWFVWPNPAKPD